MYYLIDLERSLTSGLVHYWKSNARGYTTNLSEAGLYSEDSATEIVETDLNDRTVKVHEKVLNSLKVTRVFEDGR